MSGFREIEKRIRRRLKRAKASGYLSGFEVFFVEKLLSRACCMRARVRKMHDEAYRRAVQELLNAESIFWLKALYQRELRRNATKSETPVPVPHVSGQDAE
ncbi:hypothetical protein [Pseudomonas sp. Au-Pse12]|uniref:hypothetical protein n=1 Tax=Pseudomonas sp. Au-Pse12 TaxID=2906459 RepID=UPI001E31B11D|nr:hypothetical protein [Pseudomonas sp. Au-Pse12]MCE4058443.1 hypothetical protein [Pseudomonas sp. Au-Pse12]